MLSVKFVDSGEDFSNSFISAISFSSSLGKGFALHLNELEFSSLKDALGLMGSKLA